MNHVHKLVRFSNGEIIIGETLEESLNYECPTIQMTNVFKVHQLLSEEGYQMTTIVKYMQFIEEEYISITKDHITFIANVSEDVIEYIESYDDEDLDDEEDIIEKFATSGLTANTNGESIH